MKSGPKIDLALWAFMAVVVVLVVLIVLDERDRRASQVGENRPYPYALGLAIVAPTGIQGAHILDYVVWDAGIGAWRSLDAQNRPGRYLEYVHQPGKLAVLERRRDGAQ